MNDTSRIREHVVRLTRAARMAVAVLLMFPSATGFSQCPAPPPPKVQTPQTTTKQVAIPPPKERICCIFNYAKALEPTKLGGHIYGNGGDLSASSSDTKEPVGYVYTAAAGLVDIGHVRDNADMMLWVYANLLAGQHSFSVGNDAVLVNTIPSGKDPVLALAGAIVYVSSWAHELVTWGDTPASFLLGGFGIPPSTPAEDFSAFSPEDMSSNVVGIVAATEAIDSGGDASPKAFGDQMDIALASMMTNNKDKFWLSGQPLVETDKLLTQVEFTSADKDLKGKWWMVDLSGPNMFIRLLRRNFDGTPWKIAGAPAMDTPAWMDTTRFSNLYGQFLYYMNGKLVADATQVPDTTMHALAPSYVLNWAPMAYGSLESEANLGQALGGESCLLDKSGKALGFGQYGTVNVNVDQAEPEAIIVKMKDATDTIRTAFVNANSCMPNTECKLPAGAQDAGLMDAP